MHLAACYAAPYRVQHIARRSAQLGHAENARHLQPLEHALANALYIGQFEGVQATGQLGLFNHHQAVRLSHVGRQLGQQGVGRNAD